MNSSRARERILARLTEPAGEGAAAPVEEAIEGIVAANYGDRSSRLVRFLERARAVSCEVPVDEVLSERALRGRLRNFFRDAKVVYGDGEDSRIDKFRFEGLQFGGLPEGDLFFDYALQHADRGIVESGSVVFFRSRRAEAALGLLAETHVVLLRVQDLVEHLEAAFPAVDKLLWATHIVTGPSRTADIEQTLHIGAHGPRRVVVFVYRGE